MHTSTSRHSTWLAALSLAVLGLGALPFSPLGFSPSSSARAEQPQGTWEFIDEDDGVKTWKLEIPGKELPGFRGQVIIHASIDDIMEEMLDSKHHKDWMYRCAESTVLKELSDTHAIVYNRTTAPWPVWDRDVVLDTSYERSGKTLRLEFKNVDSKLKSVPEKVVRMPLLEGFYVMKELGPNKTDVLYEVEADIGGSIPTWISERASKDLPYITLTRLRERVEARAARKGKVAAK